MKRKEKEEGKKVNSNDFYQWRACKELTSRRRKKRIIITKIQYPDQIKNRKEKEKKGGGKKRKFGQMIPISVQGGINILEKGEKEE